MTEEITSVTLVKTDDVLGSMPIGSRYRVRQFVSDGHVGESADELRARANRMLKRDHPGENPACWTAIGEKFTAADAIALIEEDQPPPLGERPSHGGYPDGHGLGD